MLLSICRIDTIASTSRNVGFNDFNSFVSTLSYKVTCSHHGHTKHETFQ